MSEPTVAQNAQASESIIPLQYNKDDAYLIHNPLQHRAVQLWEMLCEEDTATAYQEAGARTWTLIKRVFSLLFFTVTSLVALTFWLWGIGFRSGLKFRHWIEETSPSINEIITLILQVLVWPLLQAFKWADHFVQKYFGWEVNIEPTAVGAEATVPETTTSDAANSDPTSES